MNPSVTAAPPRLLSVNVGLPEDHSWSGGTMCTAIWKSPVTGARRVRRLNIDGDEQADKVGHGGEHRAVLVYQIESYAHWQAELRRQDFHYGQFGENFTVAGLADDDVHIGDQYRIGTAIFEVTQPRVTCYKLGARMGVPTMAALLVEHRRPGFYFRVLQEGDVKAGDLIERVGRPTASLSVADVDALLYLPGRDRDNLQRAVQISALSTGWRESFEDLLAKADKPAAGSWTGFQALTVTDIDNETPDIRSFTLMSPTGSALPAYSPGQYLTIRITADPDKPAAVRNYSLSSPPTGGRYRISVKREDHGIVSPWLHTNLAVGDIVQAAQARGDFVLRQSDRPLLLAGAGIGVTPLLAMLHRLAASMHQAPVIWLQVAKGPDHRPFAAEVAGLLAALPASTSHIFYTTDQRTIASSFAHEQIHQGRPDATGLRALALTPDIDAYVCGPSAFMTAMTTALAELGVDPDHIHTEAFGPSAISGGAVAPHPPTGEPGHGPSITFSRSGLEVPFADRFANLLEFAEACDVPVRWSCRTGVCQNCITPLVSGSVRYRPQPLDDPGPDWVLLCCATPQEYLVLDA
jgi:ferredoxin-NADP reductase/MOSC domain-containing protein YiiM